MPHSELRKIEREQPPAPARSETQYTELTMVSAVYATPTGGLVITGSPPIVEGLPEEMQHNCDAMGCGQEHVLLRVGSASIADLKLLLDGLRDNDDA